MVYSGQRLGSIAKRYQVSVEALCNANGLKPTDKIKPGQKLVIPGAGDDDGSQAKAANPTLERAAKTESPKEKREAESRGTLPSVDRVHRVESGQRLGSIARRYGVSVTELCEANGIKPTTTLRPGQLLSVPEPAAKPAPSNPERESKKLESRTRKPGYLEIYTYTARWRGQALDRKGRLSPSAVTAISRMLGATGGRPRLDQRLIRLLVQVSDAFGSRPIRIVSGYRTTSYFDDSRHRLSRAVDFSIPGVSNVTLRDYLRRIGNVGVGYYPNSSFVHLDVREGAAYWVDYAGPGQAPRTKPQVPPSTVAKTDGSNEHEHEHEHARERDSDQDRQRESDQNRDGAAGDSKESGTEPASLSVDPRAAKGRIPPAPRLDSTGKTSPLM